MPDFCAEMPHFSSFKQPTFWLHKAEGASSEAASGAQLIDMNHPNHTLNHAIFYVYVSKLCLKYDLYEHLYEPFIALIMLIFG